MQNKLTKDQSDYIRAAAILEKIESGEMKTKSFAELMTKYDRSIESSEERAGKAADYEEFFLSRLAEMRDVVSAERLKHEDIWK